MTRKVLFLCTGNSARSIMAEVLLNAKGGARFTACSAGSQPTGAVNPAAIAQLEAQGHATDGLRSKRWDEFAHGSALDIVITVCDNAAGESCPVWPGAPVTAHWGIPDPAAVSGNRNAVRVAFATAYARLEARIDQLLAVDLDGLDDVAIGNALNEIGRGQNAA